MRPGRKRPARRPLGSSASKWAARAGCRTGSTRSTCPMCGRRPGHALIGARQWIPREHIDDPVRSLKTGLPLDLAFRTKGQLAIDICKNAAGDGVTFDFACADEVYGNCTELREFFEASGQAYVLRVPSNFTLTLARGVTATCAEAVSGLLTGKRAKDKRLWEVRSAGKGSKGDRWYAW